MNEQSPRDLGSPEMQAARAAIDRAAAEALRRRRESGEITTYVEDGWMVREFPGGRVERLCRADEFRAEDFPHPGFTPPPRRS